jgi:ferredoxin
MLKVEKEMNRFSNECTSCGICVEGCPIVLLTDISGLSFAYSQILNGMRCRRMRCHAWSNMRCATVAWKGPIPVRPYCQRTRVREAHRSCRTAVA